MSEGENLTNRPGSSRTGSPGVGPGWDPNSPSESGVQGNYGAQTPPAPFACVIDESGGQAAVAAEQPVTSGKGGLCDTPLAVTSDPKPAKRIRDRNVLAKFHAIQQECLHCGNANVNADHLLPRSQGGDDVLPNLIGLCGSGSSGCHGARHGTPYRGDFGRYVTPQAVRESLARFLRSEAGDDARWYLTSKLGLAESRAWVERAFGEPW